MSERCETIFEHTGNRCQKEKGHSNGCFWSASNEPLTEPVVRYANGPTTSNDRHFSQAEVDTLVAAERAEVFSTFLQDMLLLLGYMPRPDECIGQATIQKALAEHDAALRLTSRLLGIEDSKGMIEQLEAENAALRRLLLKHARENHLSAARDRTTECFEWPFEDCIAKECKEARGLLGEKT